MKTPIDLSKFKKTSVENTHTTLQHPDGHEIKLLHKGLSTDMQKQLEALPMHKGGNVKLQEAAVVYKSPKQNHEQQPYPDVPNYYEGGSPNPNAPTTMGVPNPVLNALDYSGGKGSKGPTPQPTPQPTQDTGSVRDFIGFDGGGTVQPATPVQTAQDSMRKAFHFAEGGSTEDAALKENYKTEGFKRAQARGNKLIAHEVKHFADGGGTGDTAHADLAAAVKNLSGKYSPKFDMQSSEAMPTAQGESAPPQAEAPVAPVTTDAPQSAQQPTQPPTSNTVADPGQPEGTLPEQAVANTATENQAETAGAKNVQAAQAQNANIYGQQAQGDEDIRSRFEDIGNQLHEKFENLSDEVEKGNIDPHQWWDQKSTGSKILTAIGMLFGGAGVGVSGHPELASQAINTAVQRDIDAQKANLGNKQNLLSKYMDMYNNLPQAENAARLTMNAGIEGLINQQASKLGSANAINAATQTNAKRRMDLLPHMEELAKGQAMTSMYGGLSNPSTGTQGAQGPNDPESQYQESMRRMRILNPDLGKDMENKYLPGVGVSRVPVPDKLREELAARADLSDKLAKLELFSKQHSGTTMNRALVNEGTTLARNAQDSYRRANAQGVFREAEKDFVEKSINSDPTSFMSKYRTMPGYQTTRKLNNDTIKQFYHAYGIKPFNQAQGSQGPQGQTATMNGISYRKVPGGWQKAE